MAGPFQNEVGDAATNGHVANTTGNHQGRMAYVPGDLLPKTIVGPLFEQAQEQSLVLRAPGARQINIGLGDTTFPVSVKKPAAGQVGVGTAYADREGYRKPVDGVEWGTKTFAPIKLATVITVSDEFLRSNPSGLYSQIQSDLAGSIARAVDLAVFKGLDAQTGAALQGADIPANVLSNTTNVTYLGADPAGIQTDDLIAMYRAASASRTSNFTGWTADPVVRADLALQSIEGLQNQTVNLNQQVSNVLGFPVQYGRAVSGAIDAATEDTTRIIGGDFSQLVYGFADNVRVKVSDQTVVDGVSMWQTNQVALLCEATFGWIVGDLSAFAKGVAEADPTP